MKLRKVVSGGQTGADIAGLEVAKKFGFETGGIMPFGFKTLDGCRPEYKDMYGLTAHNSSSYVPRTRANVRDSDGTIRLAFNLESRGEICTLKAIKDYGKSWIDVDFSSDSAKQAVKPVVEWLHRNEIEILNVAGNAEQTWAGTYEAALQYLERLFEQVKGARCQ